MDLEGSVLKICKLTSPSCIGISSLDEEERRQKGKKTNFISIDIFVCGKLESYSH